MEIVFVPLVDELDPAVPAVIDEAWLMVVPERERPLPAEYVVS